MATNIEWTDATWNPSTGCTKVSPGCAHCYAETLTKRYAGSPGWPETFLPWVPGNDTVVLHPDRLDAPLHWRTPRRVFVDSMSDLFHDDVPTDFILNVFRVMNDTPRHTYQVLTKRSDRLAALAPLLLWTPNIWIGVSVESNGYKSRIDDLRRVPAPDNRYRVRFVSFEPLLGELDHLNLTGIQWAICGGESGPGARPMPLPWARKLLGDCRKSGTAFFMKQLGGVTDKRGGMSHFPHDLQVREMPVGPAYQPSDEGEAA